MGKKEGDEGDDGEGDDDEGDDGVVAAGLHGCGELRRVGQHVVFWGERNRKSIGKLIYLQHFFEISKCGIVVDRNEGFRIRHLVKTRVV